MTAGIQIFEIQTGQEDEEGIRREVLLKASRLPLGSDPTDGETNFLSLRKF